MAFKYRVALAHAAIVAFVSTQGVPAFANPTGGAVAAGSATIRTGPAKVTVHQTSDRAIINWQSFSIGAGEQTRLKLPSSSSAILNRVTSSNPSAIYGTLKSNGQVFLLNPNGILIGPNGQIKTGGFVASALDVNNAAFMAGGPLSFFGAAPAGIVNLGTIRTNSGDVALFASQVQNAGTIVAPNGTVALASGSQILYAPGSGDGSIVIQAPPLTAPNGTAVDNSGVIAAAAAQLKAAAGSPYALAVNNGGVISATSVHNDGGRVILDGGTGATNIGGTIHADAVGSGNGGSVTVKSADTTFSGTITARGGPNGGNGGNAEVSGATLQFLGLVDLSAPHGATGTLLLDPIVIDTSAASGINTSLGTANVVVNASDSITVGAAINGTAASNSLTLDAPTIAVNAPITLGTGPGATLVFQNTSGTTTGSSLTSASGASIVANQINVIGPIDNTNFSGTLAGGLSIGQTGTPGFTATSFNATNSNAITNLTFGTGTFSTGGVANSTTTGGTPGSVAAGTGTAFSGNVAVNNGVGAMTISGQPTAGSYTLTALGNLTLNAGAILTSTGGNTVLAATSGAFINNAGAGVVAGSGRKIIYTATDAGGFNPGGLTYTQLNPVSYNSDPVGSGNVIYIANASGLPLMMITANNASRIYGSPDGSFSASFTNGSSSDLFLPIQFNIQQGSDTNAGTYTIVPFGATSSTHRIAFVNGTLTVNPAQLLITVNASTTYGSTPAFVPTVSGFVNGDSASNVSVSVPTFGTLATSSSPVGTYSVTPGSATISSSNYMPVYQVGTLTINPAPLIVSGPTLTTTYGTDVFSQIFNAAFSGFVNNESAATFANQIQNNLIFHTQAQFFGAANVGTYSMPLSGLTLPNYAITFVPGTVTVNPAELFFTVNSLQASVGQPFPAFSATFTGLKLADGPGIVTGMQFATNATPSSPLGAYVINALQKPNGSWGNAGPNYTLVPSASSTGTLALIPNVSQATFVVDDSFKNAKNYTPNSNSFNATPASNVVSVTYVPADDLLGLGPNSPAYSYYEVNAIAAYAASVGKSASDVTKMLQDPSQRTSVLTGVVTSIFNDVKGTLGADASTWTPQQKSLITAVENFISNQRQAAYAQAAADYEQAQTGFALGPSGVAQANAVNKAYAGINLSAAQMATANAIVNGTEASGQTSVQIGKYTGSDLGSASTAFAALLAAASQTAKQPVTVDTLKSIDGDTTKNGPTLFDYIAAMMVTSNP